MLDYISVCTRAKHGHATSVMGGSDPEELWAAESRQKWGRSRPSECFARVQIRRFRFTHLVISLVLAGRALRKLARNLSRKSLPRAPSPALLLSGRLGV